MGRIYFNIIREIGKNIVDGVIHHVRQFFAIHLKITGSFPQIRPANITYKKRISCKHGSFLAVFIDQKIRIVIGRMSWREKSFHCYIPDFDGVFVFHGVKVIADTYLRIDIDLSSKSLLKFKMTTSKIRMWMRFKYGDYFAIMLV